MQDALATAKIVRRWLLAIVGAVFAYLVVLVLTLDISAVINGGPILVFSSIGIATLFGSTAGVIIAPRQHWKISSSFFVGISFLFALALFVSDSIGAQRVTNLSEVVSAGIGGAFAYVVITKRYGKAK